MLLPRLVTMIGKEQMPTRVDMVGSNSSSSSHTSSAVAAVAVAAGVAGVGTTGMATTTTGSAAGTMKATMPLGMMDQGELCAGLCYQQAAKQQLVMQCCLCRQ